jgi:NAD(P)-dependent dehydrogenase (short-subunit alcohol dehydrogenase family)
VTGVEGAHHRARQRTINSPFGYRSTAADVLDGLDLRGQLAVVTGGYSGIGLETVRALSAAGCTVIVPARRPETAAAALRGIERTTVAELDLGDLDSVGRFAEQQLAPGRDIAILINNAGIMACPETRLGPGWEAQFAINHLGHFALTNLLRPALVARQGARVVALSSMYHQRCEIRFEDPHFETGYDRWQAYAQSKTANSLFAVHLDRLGAPFGVRAFAVHPGGIMTTLQRHVPTQEMIDSGWIDEHGNVDETFKTAEQGAASSTWAATSPLLGGIGGVYCEDCDVAEIITTPDGAARGVARHAVDPVAAERLWQMSAGMTGLDSFGAAVRS